MQNIKNTTTEAEHKNNTDIENRRKRVNRIKTAIIILAIFFLILPTIFCIILGIQVNRLQNQMKELIDIHSQYGLNYEETDHINYAYAAEKTSDPQEVIEDSEDSLLANVTNEQEIDDGVQTLATLTESNLQENNLENNENLSGPIKNDSKTSDDAKNKDKDQTESTVSITGVYAEKKVYLTFDDGPSVYTDKILDILAEYNVKATFFVIGKTDDESKEVYQRIVEDGHSLGMHSYSHKYEKIYNSVEDFDKDFTKLRKLLYDTTGYKPSIFRFPGGSDNQVNKNGMDKFIHYLNEADIVYFDWNVLNGDATGVVYSKDQLIGNVLSGVAKKNTSIVLLHDSQSKKTTVDSLPGLLEELIEGGAEILPLDNEVTPIQMIKADSVN